MAEHWDIRRATGSDLSFIYSTWLNSYKKDSVIGKSVSKSTFYSEYTKVIDWILANPESATLVACLKDDPVVILGYMVTQLPNIVHYLFVKENFRAMGVAKSLINHFVKYPPILTYSHKTTRLSQACDLSDSDYNPFVLFKKGESNGREEKAY